MLRQFQASLFLFIYCLVRVNNGQQTDFCHRNSSKSGLHWSDVNGPANLVIGCESEWVDMVCCTTHFRKIVWYQSIDNTTSSTWREFMSIRNITRKTSNDSQMATITELNRQTDSGFYKCVAHGYNGETIENIAVIDIRNCTEWSYPPIPLNPLSNFTSFEVRRRDSIHIVCSSISGVNCDDSFCIYVWNKLYPPFGVFDYDQIPVTTDTSTRVRVTKEFSRNGLRMEAVLHIESVTDDDYNVKFLCIAGNKYGYTYDRIIQLNPPYIRIPVAVVAVGGTLLVIVVLLSLVNSQIRADLDVRIWWTKRSLKKRHTQEDASADYDVALLFCGREPFAFYVKQTLQRDFNLKVFSEDELNFGIAPISCVPEGAKRSRSVLVVMTPEVHEDNVFLAIISETISDATPVFVEYRMDSSDVRSTDPPRLDRNITGAMEVRPPLRWPGRVCDREVNPSDGPDSLDEGLIAKYWEGSRSRQVKTFWKKLLLSLVTMEKTRVVSTGNVRQDSVSSPLLTPGIVQHDQCPKSYSSVNV